MKICVIGGNGKTGMYLLPMLVNEGHEVICVSRGTHGYYRQDEAFSKVTEVHLTRGSETFEKDIAALGADVVVDTICFTPEDMLRLIREIRGTVRHYIVTGSVWIHGHGTQLPYTEDEDRHPFGDYGIRKLAMAEALHTLYREEGFPGTIVHPGHIVAPGVDPVISPQGNPAVDSFLKLKNGEELLLPNAGLETVHHVHARDVAGIIDAAIRKGSVTFGEEFHAVSRRAMSLRGYAESTAALFGQEAKLRYLPFEEFRREVGDSRALSTLDHISHSPSASIGKTERVLDYHVCSTMDAIREHLVCIGLLEAEK